MCKLQNTDDILRMREIFLLGTQSIWRWPWLLLRLLYSIILLLYLYCSFFINHPSLLIKCHVFLWAKRDNILSMTDIVLQSTIVHMLWQIMPILKQRNSTGEARNMPLVNDIHGWEYRIFMKICIINDKLIPTLGIFTTTLFWEIRLPLILKKGLKNMHVKYWT